jgi:hypothetical protein
MELSGGTSALEQLEILVGDWMMEVGPAGQPPWPGEAWVTFEWLRDRAFLIERWVVPAALDGIALIGPSEQSGTFHRHYIDGRGEHRIYEMTVRDGGLDAAARCTGSVPPAFHRRHRGGWKRDHRPVGEAPRRFVGTRHRCHVPEAIWLSIHHVRISGSRTTAPKSPRERTAWTGTSPAPEIPARPSPRPPGDAAGSRKKTARPRHERVPHRPPDPFSDDCRRAGTSRSPGTNRRDPPRLAPGRGAPPARRSCLSCPKRGRSGRAGAPRGSPAGSPFAR